MAKLKMEVTAEEGQFIGAMRNMTEAQKRVVMGNRGIGSSANRAGQQLMQMAARFAGPGAAVTLGIKLFHDWRKEIQEGVRELDTFQNAFQELQFMADNFRRSNEMRKGIRETAGLTGIGREQISRLRTELQSGMAGATPAQLKEWERATINLAKTGPPGELPPAAYVPALSKARSLYDLSPTQAANLVMMTAEGAQVSRGEITGGLTKALAGGAAAGMPAHQAAAMFKVLTGQEATAQTAGERTRQILSKLVSLTPEQMGAYGISATDDAWTRFKKIAGKADTAGMIKVYGQEAGVSAKVLAGRISDVEATTVAFGKGMAGPEIAAAKLEAVRAMDPVFAGKERRERIAQGRRTEREERAEAVLIEEEFKDFVEYSRQRKGHYATTRFTRRLAMDVEQAAGGDIFRYDLPGGKGLPGRGDLTPEAIEYLLWRKGDIDKPWAEMPGLEKLAEYRQALEKNTDAINMLTKRTKDENVSDRGQDE